MIQTSKYNGINFSYDFTRESNRYNFDLQRVKNLLPFDSELKYLSFFYDGQIKPTSIIFLAHYNSTTFNIPHDSVVAISGGWLIYLTIPSTSLVDGTNVYFSLTVEGETIYSEIYGVTTVAKMQQSEICKVIATNNDNRHGYLTNQAFGFFKFSRLKSDIFLNKKVEYEYSYSRKKILSSENQIAKRFTFLDLTMYNANLLKWLCNCENLSIDGVSYQLISDFTELEVDQNSEILNLQGDFVEVDQYFFGTASTIEPKNVFPTNLFN